MYMYMYYVLCSYRGVALLAFNQSSSNGASLVVTTTTAATDLATSDFRL